MLEILLQMLLSIFALFGIYCLIRLAIENHYTPKGLVNAVEVLSRDDVRALPERIDEINRRLSVPGGSLYILIPLSLYEDPELREDLDAVLIEQNAEILIIGNDENALSDSSER